MGAKVAVPSAAVESPSEHAREVHAIEVHENRGKQGKDADERGAVPSSSGYGETVSTLQLIVDEVKECAPSDDEDARADTREKSGDGEKKHRRRRDKHGHSKAREERGERGEKKKKHRHRHEAEKPADTGVGAKRERRVEFYSDDEGEANRGGSTRHALASRSLGKGVLEHAAPIQADIPKRQAKSVRDVYSLSYSKQSISPSPTNVSSAEDLSDTGGGTKSRRWTVEEDVPRHLQMRAKASNVGRKPSQRKATHSHSRSRKEEEKKKRGGKVENEDEEEEEEEEGGRKQGKKRKGPHPEWFEKFEYVVNAYAADLEEYDGTVKFDTVDDMEEAELVNLLIRQRSAGRALTRHYVRILKDREMDVFDAFDIIMKNMCSGNPETLFLACVRFLNQKTTFMKNMEEYDQAEKDGQGAVKGEWLEKQRSKVDNRKKKLKRRASIELDKRDAKALQNLDVQYPRSHPRSSDAAPPTTSTTEGGGGGRASAAGGVSRCSSRRQGSLAAALGVDDAQPSQGDRLPPVDDRLLSASAKFKQVELGLVQMEPPSTYPLHSESVPQLRASLQRLSAGAPLQSMSRPRLSSLVEGGPQDAGRSAGLEGSREKDKAVIQVEKAARNIYDAMLIIDSAGVIYAAKDEMCLLGRGGSRALRGSRLFDLLSGGASELRSALSRPFDLPSNLSFASALEESPMYASGDDLGEGRPSMFATDITRRSRVASDDASSRAADAGYLPFQFVHATLKMNELQAKHVRGRCLLFICNLSTKKSVRKVYFCGIRGMPYRDDGGTVVEEDDDEGGAGVGKTGRRRGAEKECQADSMVLTMLKSIPLVNVLKSANIQGEEEGEGKKEKERRGSEEKGEGGKPEKWREEEKKGEANQREGEAGKVEGGISGGSEEGEGGKEEVKESAERDKPIYVCSSEEGEDGIQVLVDEWIRNMFVSALIGGRELSAGIGAKYLTFDLTLKALVCDVFSRVELPPSVGHPSLSFSFSPHLGGRCVGDGLLVFFLVDIMWKMCTDFGGEVTKLEVEIESNPSLKSPPSEADMNDTDEHTTPSLTTSRVSTTLTLNGTREVSTGYSQVEDVTDDVSSFFSSWLGQKRSPSLSSNHTDTSIVVQAFFYL
mmetsp:Transcript_20960/g.54119  ORF Transcript_20960/g.54119 Transcript_20960/m.54119 type:complete len:1114 (-) Transcript_20960:112-3453(-)